MFQKLTVVCLVAVLFESAHAAEKPVSIDEVSTHRQVSLIKIASGNDDSMRVNAFCLNAHGEILAACGNGPGEVRVLDDRGELLRSWSVEVKPEAINTAEDGTILVGGDGKLFRFDSTGKELQRADSPHAAALRANTRQLREEAIARLTSSSNSLPSRIAMYEQVIKQLEDKATKQELNTRETQLLDLLPKTLQAWKAQLAKQPRQDKKDLPSEEAIAEQMENLLKSKMRVASISTDDKYVFIATRALSGYGFAIWRLDTSFDNGEVIVSGLRGCCGQMDVQACGNGLYVAENARHRVVHYDVDGKELRTWGKGDRKGLEGFTSCCNPMNVCFSKDGEVFTAESSSGRIKRFSHKGEFVDHVGDVKLVPGCKNVSIAVSPLDERVYMLDITRNHIVLMERKVDETSEATSQNATGSE